MPYWFGGWVIPKDGKQIEAANCLGHLVCYRIPADHG